MTGLSGFSARAPVRPDQILVDQRAHVLFEQQVDLVDLVAGAKAVEEMQERHSSPERGHVGDHRHVLCLLDARGASSAKPVVRAAITSLWSPKIDSACVASVRAAMWNTAGDSSPAILNMLGSLSSSPCEAVNVVVRAPACSEPCTAPAAPASLCISITCGTMPQMFLVPAADHASANSPIVETA